VSLSGGDSAQASERHEGMHPSTHLRETKQKSRKKKDDRQANRFHGKSRTQKGTTTEIPRNPNLLIKTPKKLTDEQTSRQQI
jgi:hypothetical protein